jgi:hypothetical protein
MKALRFSLALTALALTARANEEFFDRLENALTFSAVDSRVRARVSGTLELEAYDLQLPALGVIDSSSDQLFVPRLSVFLDAQFGSRLYAFLQARADRGFDPSNRNGEVRLDEYALRYTPWRHGRLNVQIGKFATVVGNWANRHGGWSNPFINAPVPYEYLTGIWDTEAVRNSNQLLQWSHVRPGLSPANIANEKSLRLPIVWGPAYSTGAAISGDVGRLRYAAEVKMGSLSSRPEAWRHAREQRHHPSVAARLGYRPSPMWNVGVSASRGIYLREFAESTVVTGFSRSDYTQTVIAHDLAFAWHHLQIWAEIYASRFEVPTVGEADTVAYYMEAKYKFSPRFSGAVRWNQQVFNRIPDRGVMTRWGKNIWRIDIAPAFRFTSHTQLKFQYSLQRGDSGDRDYTRMLATQLVVRF